MTSLGITPRTLTALLTLQFALAAFFLALTPASAAGEAGLWQTVQSGEAFAMMRHELAPGTGDPEHFNVGDCATQRNLNDVGRERASTTGKRFRDNGIVEAEVYSSQWCRCKETAALLGIGTVQELPALNSFYENYEQRAPQTAALKAWLLRHSSGKPLVFVTHQVNIRALTGRPASSGEIIVAKIDRTGEVVVLGSL